MITIKIGNIEKNYIVYKTNAPISYDGFGTFTGMTYHDDRYVLIQDVHEVWQTMRYASGSYPFTKLDDEIIDAGFIVELWNKITNNE